MYTKEKSHGQTKIPLQNLEENPGTNPYLLVVLNKVLVKIFQRKRLYLFKFSSHPTSFQSLHTCNIIVKVTK